jgi:hypothetical protein
MAGESPQAEKVNPFVARMNAAADRVNAVLEKPVGMVQAVVNFFMKDGTIAAIGREAIKDIGDTFLETAYGQSGHGHEPGGPLTPLYMDIANARDQYQQENTAMSQPSPSQIAKENSPSATVHGQAREAGPSPQPSPSEIAKDQATVHGRSDGGRDMAENEKPWAKEIGERSEGGNDQNERREARVLPEEQREQRKEQERGRGR